MAKLSSKLRSVAGGDYAHWCPGCKCMHVFNVGTRNATTNASWTFNNNVDLPTFSPSMLIYIDEPVDWDNEEGPKKRVTVCHYILTDGIMHFCGDCEHALKGQSVPLPDLDEKGNQNE